MIALDEFLDFPRWVAWRNELRDGKLTKVPYSPRSGGAAKANDPKTWGFYLDAKELAKRIVNGKGGGVGIQLGDLSDGTTLIGIDLDTCRDGDGNIAAWAMTVIERIGSYTEISPSATGVKIFARLRTEDMPLLRAALGDAKFSRMFTRHGAGREHPPAIEVHLGNRYFAVTEWHLDGTPSKLVLVDAPTVLWVLTEYGPAFAEAASAAEAGTGSRDNSRSAIAYRVGREARRAGATFEEMCDTLRGDPTTAKWYADKGDKRQLRRIWNKAEAVAGRNLPVVQLGGGKLPVNIDEAEELLIEYDREVFQRGDMVIRPAPETIAISDYRQALGMRLVQIKATHLVDRLTRIIDFKRYDARSEDWVSVNCPAELATAYLERVGEWRLPVLKGIIDAPTLRADGSILDKPGYDADTGILYAPSGEYPKVPVSPSRDDALAALGVLCGLISKFPFIDHNDNVAVDKPTPSRSVALSLILTAIIRRSIAHAPLHAFDAPVMGSGKSKLVDIASMIATGHEAPVISQGSTEEELEKRLGAALIAGDVLISLDNCEQPLGGELLCQALTQKVLKIRILGKSVLVSLPTDSTFAATGNNLVVAGDMVRRTVVSTLDPKVERPELRKFENDPIETIRAQRAPFVIAALTVLRAYVVAGMPDMGLAPLGSFEDWSAKIRNSLVWLGEPDPCATMDVARAQDPQTLALVAVLTTWFDTISSRSATLKRVVEMATEPQNVDLHDALTTVAGERGVISPKALGQWMLKVKGRVVRGLRVEQDGNGTTGGVRRWRVVQA